jgi:hypothetical protein
MHVLSPMVGIHLMYYDCHNATESASRDGVFFRYHGRLADTYHFLGRDKDAHHMFKRCDR